MLSHSSLQGESMCFELRDHIGHQIVTVDQKSDMIRKNSVPQ